MSDARTPTSHTHTKSEITDFPTLATVATSGSYSDLSNKPTIPTVNNATLTIQKNGTTVDTFTANSSSDKTVNISVPTKTSDLNNDSGFITSDSTKIPLAGTSALAGSIAPSTDDSVDLGSSSKNIKMLYTKGITINGTQFLPSDYIPRSGGAVITGTEFFKTSNTSYLQLCAGNAWNNGGGVVLWGKDNLSLPGVVTLKASDGTNKTSFDIYPSGGVTLNNNGTTKNIALAEDVVPRSGGAVMTGSILARNINDSALVMCGGTHRDTGAAVSMFGGDYSLYQLTGAVKIFVKSSSEKNMYIYPSGTWTWSGQAVQLVSDQRLKQQITEIDDKLLDAWEDVNLVQFKYNDAVDTKKDNARLHTGYVVQQIDEACKSHGVDISEYGLYCHEEYPEETEEVEVEQEDGAKTKERKVIREASEHYSLRYTETLVVECAYLRRENARLKERLQRHDDYFSNIEKRLQSLENS